MRIALFAIALLVVLAGPAAAETQPGDACATVNQLQMTGGPETTGVRDFLFCNGSTWQSTVRFTSTGKVGIGTTSPGYALDVQSGTNTNARFGSTHPVYLVSSDPGIYFNLYWLSSAAKYATTNAYGGLVSVDASTGLMKFHVTPTIGAADATATTTVAMAITKTGNVGIGNASPTDRLDIQGGQLRIDDDTNTTNKGCIRYNGTSHKLEYADDCSVFSVFSGAGVATQLPELLFSRTTAVYSATLATKDSACTTDFGSEYQAATRSDVAANWHGPAPAPDSFNVVSASSWTLVYASGVLTWTAATNSTWPVACVRKTSTLLFSRTTAVYSATLATKDSACTTDYGSEYQAATRSDVAANWRGPAPAPDSFNVVSASSWTLVYASGVLTWTAATNSTWPVACIRKQ